MVHVTKMVFVSPQGGEASFDDWVADEDLFGGPSYWTQICPSCYKKLKDALEGKCADAAISDSICGSEGCMNRAAWYVDFRPGDVAFTNARTPAEQASA